MKIRFLTLFLRKKILKFTGSINTVAELVNIKIHLAVVNSLIGINIYRCVDVRHVM